MIVIENADDLRYEGDFHPVSEEDEPIYKGHFKPVSEEDDLRYEGDFKPVSEEDAPPWPNMAEIAMDQIACGTNFRDVVGVDARFGDSEDFILFDDHSVLVSPWSVSPQIFGNATAAKDELSAGTDQAEHNCGYDDFCEYLEETYCGYDDFIRIMGAACRPNWQRANHPRS
jgi:hypothetical protein